MELWIGALNLGLLYSVMSIGTFITYKIYNFPDVTIDSSFTTGAAISSVLIILGMSPLLTLPVVFFFTSLAGVATGFIHTKFKINGLLSGILVMTALYSVNLRIMDKSNLSLLNKPTFITLLQSINPGWNFEVWLFTSLVILLFFFWVLISAFFLTNFGVSMRSTGNNAIMASASGVNVDLMKIIGIMIANAFAGLSGALIAQYQGFADIGMGTGAVVFSLAAVIIGEAMIKTRNIYFKVLSVFIGSMLFRIMVALALFVGLNPNDLKLITALFVLVTLVMSNSANLNESLNRYFKVFKKFSNSKYSKKIKYFAYLLIILTVVTIIAKKQFFTSKLNKTKIGIIIPNDAQILTLTRDGLLEELKNLGYENGKNCEIIERNANGDIPLLNTIVEHMITEKVDIFVSISTVSTQALINKVKDKPIIFATVANPFSINVGKTDSVHLPNATGVYGLAPMFELITYAKAILKNELKIGAIYNSSFANSLVNMKVLRGIVEKEKDIKLIETTVNNTLDVQQAASSLVNKGIDAFVLIPDITVFAAFESLLQAIGDKKVPVFTNEVERLADGAVFAYGYNYKMSGRQAAHLLSRVEKGEDISKIPFEKNRYITMGVNLDAAKKNGIYIDKTIIDKVDIVVENGKVIKRKDDDKIDLNKNYKHIAVFQFADNVVVNETVEGMLAELKNIESTGWSFDIVTYKAHGDFGVAQSISKDITSKNFDYIVTASTIAMQSIFSHNKKRIPHVFCAVTDPIKAGAGNSLNDHLPNATGLATPQPVDATIKLMKALFPNLKRLGMIWTSSEINSQLCTEMARAACAKYGIVLVEKTITGSNEIDEALNSILQEEIDAFLTSGDSNVSVAIGSVAKKLNGRNIPFFTNAPKDIKIGSIVSVGANYYDVGQEAIRVFKRVLLGEKPGNIPIKLFVPNQYAINYELVKKYKVVIPDSIKQNALK